MGVLMTKETALILVTNEPVGSYCIFHEDGWYSVFVKTAPDHWSDVSKIKTHLRGIHNAALADWLSVDTRIDLWSFS